MNRLIALTCSVAFSSVAAFADPWTTDYDAALKTAHQQNRAMFLFFTGSDWCGWCKRLNAEVLETKEFLAFAEKNLVLVKIDFPRSTSLPKAQAQKNQQLATHFGIEGFPTVNLISSQGKNVGQLGYMPGGPSAFIGALKKVPDVTWREPKPAAALASSSANKAEAPLFNGAPVFPPKVYDDLQVKAITGTMERRLAMINNQTLALGETARVKLKDREVRVTCKEIRDRSVVVQVEGEKDTKEIFLP